MSAIDLKTELRKCLTAEKKYIPYWYKYDKKGVDFFNDCLLHNKDYYFPKSEISILKSSSKEILSSIPKPYLICDLGCGNAEKSSFLVEQYLKTTSTCTFVPIDICKEMVEEVKGSFCDIYGESVDVHSISGDYYTAVPIVLKNFPTQRKLFTCFGSLQNIKFSNQIELLSFLAAQMSFKDYLLLTLDITEDKRTIERAYDDDEGLFKKLDIRGFQRLIEEEKTNLNLKNFEFEAKYAKGPDRNIPGGMQAWIRSLCKQKIDIDSLNISIDLRPDDKIFIAEDGFYSYKYTEQHLETLFQKSGLKLSKTWKNKHCALVMLTKLL